MAFTRESVFNYRYYGWRQSISDT